ncbi:MAG: NADH-quinone oxidoreductase subunit NuoG [Armatimonadota bacterium]|nr:NADH-quinone oxidoreductase subunit NuoG [Armatimonadota bacterium]MDR7436107.1 NADH-quinone oxidoreductase subunit NuoG [Armatimonadota bacterium]MDR7471986.1 NADH-quinone oxidoreductase subunit NuoG [Armatimonadota bacterium]MDR7506730.1 NADH-quinone oxidoreductase subunit NuoG [Armatimonadota bacterium]MDR7508642.1 NADH-quinone oxidoreductase subunit NuoG [Armatimonadota bacterium]
MSQPTVTLTIDGRTVTVPRGTTVYQAARAAGVEIPIFCYHDRMPPLGACRMCLVKVEKMPRLQTSCTLEAADGMVVSTTAPEVVAGQRAILEFLLINHPLDCPICDKGGECPLQDQTVRFGPGRSRFVEAKRDFAKPVSLGPVLVLDRERCILCWRCVRFGEIVAGDDALKGFERGFRSEINTPFTVPAQSKFIGNTIAICPVGALTARPYRFVARPWDNRPVPGACTLCGVGCAVEFDVRDGRVVRVRAREEPAVNDIWLCDLGFFGHAAVSHPDRLRTPLVRRDGLLVEASWDEALDVVASRLRAAAPGRVAVLGGARLTTEDAYVAVRFFRGVVGTPHLDHRVDAAPGGASLLVGWGMRRPIADLDRADVVVLVGCDLTEEYPVLWLRCKRAVDRGAAVIAVTPRRLEIGRFVRAHLVHRFGDGARVLDALLAGTDSPPAGVDPAALAAAVEAIRGARSPVVMVGRLALEAPDGVEILRRVRDLAARWGVPVDVLRGKGNARGAALAGLLPDAGPGGRPLDEVREVLRSAWGSAASAEVGWTAPEIVERAARGEVEVLFALGADPASEVPDRSRWSDARRRVSLLVAVDAFLSPTARAADVVLPALMAPEKDGTVCGLDGRVHRLHAAVPGPGAAWAEATIFSALADRLGRVLVYSGWEEIFDEMRAFAPSLAVGERIPPPPDRPLPEPAPQEAPAGDGFVLIPGDVLFDRGAVTSRSPAIAELAGEPWALLHPADASRLGVADGDPVVLRGERGEAAVRARVAPDILPGQVFLPRGFDEAPANALADGIRPARVRIIPLAAGGSGGRP